MKLLGQHKELYDNISKILWEDWNPINITIEEGFPADEYDGYISKIFSMIVNENADARTIANKLIYFDTNDFGFSASKENETHYLQIAEKIIVIKNSPFK